MQILIKNAKLVDQLSTRKLDVLIENQKIKQIADCGILNEKVDKVIDAEGLLLIPGVIDDQVHFREPGLTHKADIFSESRAAAAGGVTSYMEMPNTNPSTISMELFNQKMEVAEQNSLVNYSFFIGATNDNNLDIEKIDSKIVAGIKMFLGSSTGSLLINNEESIKSVLKAAKTIVAAHCEDDSVIENNMQKYLELYGEDIPIKHHADIRSEEACYSSSSKLVDLAKSIQKRVHLFHLSTAKEVDLLEKGDLDNKNITAEVCVHHLWFNDLDYDKYGTKIKWNPSIKKETDRLALIQALVDGKIDVVATDHAPHTEDEKNNVYSKAPSGAPMVQHSLLVMLELASQGYFSIEDVVKWMCNNPAELFKINNRGFIKEGYYADLVLIDPNTPTHVTKDTLLYKCKWSPLEGQIFKNSIKTTFVNGEIVYDGGEIINTNSAMNLEFDR